MHTVETVTVGGSPMEIFVFAPEAPGPHPGIVMAMHIPGHTGIEKDAFTLDAADRYAKAGYVVAVPFLFHRFPKDEEMGPKREGFRDDECAQDLQAAFDLLKARDDVKADRIGIVGHCWGGRVSWLGAATNPDYAACVVFYGGNIRKPLGPEGTPAPIDLASNIACKVRGFFGNDDQYPTPEDVDAYDAALTKAGVPHEFTRYDGAGHAFQSFNAPERYNEAASEDAWGKAIAFLDAELK